MAEAVAAAWAAEEAVSTGVQAGVGAYLISKPTMPLKATFRQLPAPADEKISKALTRADHSLSIVKDMACIFGGELEDLSLATNDVYTFIIGNGPSPDYKVISAIPDVPGDSVPPARKKHAACAFNICVAVYGGVDSSGQTINEDGAIWLFNTSKLAWEVMRPAGTEKPQPRYSARLFDHENNLVLYGGHDSTGRELKDTWLFDYVAKTWTQLAESPVSTLSVTVADGVIYAIAGSDDMSSVLHYLELPPHEKPADDSIQEKQHTWEKVEFPTNPLTPGPRPRIGAGLSHIFTGHGRNYLAYFFGARQVGGATSATDERPAAAADDPTNQDPLYWSDIWTYQAPSTDHKASDLTEAIKPAKIKDSIRHFLGLDSGTHSWAEVEVLPPTELDATAGKVHPGPRGWFGFDHASNGHMLVVWGGVNAKGEKEGDGWAITLG